MQVQRSIRKKGRFVKRFAIAVVFLFALVVIGWFARPWLRERWYDYRDAQMRAEISPPVSLRARWYDIRDWQARRDIPPAVTLDATPEPTNYDAHIRKLPMDLPLEAFEAPPLTNEDWITAGGKIPASATALNLPSQPKSGPPATKNLFIPFVSQAPNRVWDMPYQEACEEASAIMASLYYQGDERAMVIGDAGDALLKKAIAWENERFGYYKDTTVAETVILLEEYFKLRARIVDDPTVEQIKEAVAAGKPVMVPAYGKVLPNPYFKNGGPLYHMLVVKGYTETKFITNDPGTNTRGAEFTYTFDALMNAIHDWNNGDVPNGAKRIIIVEGP